ncbi:alpha-1,6-glucosidase domain-containing protein [Arsukibacterium sp.]|uniref:alpha-1,6-glucosidase domain-containing protein n=1 Tax=Arsukibacterium sp. TaxID=1977258 RepID=UPI002FD9AF16
MENGTLVYTATATDANNDSITFSLTDPRNIFSINSSSGAVTVTNASALAAAAPSYTITITANDGRQGVANRTVTVNIELVQTGIQPSVTPAGNQAVIYYYRQDSDYDGWILHAWNNEECNAYADYADNGGTEWETGLAPSGLDENFGVYWLFEIKSAASCANYIVHKGNDKDPDDNDQKLDLSTDRWAFLVSGIGIFYAPEDVEFTAPFAPTQASAHWIDTHTLVWNGSGTDVRLMYSEDASLASAFSSAGFISLTASSLTSAQQQLVPHLASWNAYQFEAEPELLRTLVKSQLAVAEFDSEQEPVRATYVQTAKALDALYTRGDDDADEAELGIRYDGDVIHVAVWAPSAKTLKLNVYNAAKTRVASYPMTENTDSGVWHYQGTQALDRQFYRFEIEVYHPLTRRIEVIEATDPYSVNTSTNGRFSQFVNLTDADLKPAGWDARVVPVLAAVEDAVLLEAHVRDFSIFDATTSAAARGKYMAFTEVSSDANKNLQRLAEAGVTHLHLLPFNDLANIEESAANRIDLQNTVAELCARVASAPVCGVESGAATLLSVFQSYDPASGDAYKLVDAMRGLDGFNWGYDPHHFNVIEGSYASNPDGVQRIIEFRQMVQAVQSSGLQIVMDVVYNHTASSGLFDNSVFDKLVPGYYHRYNEVTGIIERSTCCENTASEHRMMAKFVIDSLVHWVEHYGINGVRFDVMGHMPADLILAGREAVQQIDANNYFYGEGWNFGEVANNRLFTQATQYNLAGSKIGTFNDRPRDTIRAAALSQQNVNLSSADHIRLGMAGTLQNYELRDKDGQRRKGINFSQSSYALTPADIINYVDKHDNETLWDALQYALPNDMQVEDRVRLHLLSAAIPIMSQGIPFFQLGLDQLRSKSMDRNSFDSGDWFNAVRYDGINNNWNVGLPRIGDNPNQSLIGSISANPNIAVSSADIYLAQQVFAEFLNIRRDSPLFRLTSEQAVLRRVGFHNTGPVQIPGVIVKSIDDGIGQSDLDPAQDAIVVVVNGTAATVTPRVAAASGFSLHPVQQASADSRVQQASFSMVDGEGQFSVPAYTVAVFVKPQVGAQGVGLPADPDFVPSPFGEAVLYAEGLTAQPAEMQYDGSGNYTVGVTLTSGAYQFSISDLADIELNFADVVAADETINFSAAENGQIAFNAAANGTYLISLNVAGADYKLAIQLQNELVACQLADSAEAPPFAIAGGGSLFVRGSHSGWNPMPEFRMSYKGENRYQAVAEFDGEFEFKLASDDGSWTTQLWVQQDNGQIDTSTLQVGIDYNVAYNDAGTNNNRTSLVAGTYSFLLTLNSANPARGANVGSLVIEQCLAD